MTQTTHAEIREKMIWAGKVQVTIAEFCVAYPAGLAACITATAGAIAIKDRQVAKAKAETDSAS